MKKLMILVFLVLGARQLRAQLVTVKETSANPIITLVFANHPIVDINSKLTVEIKKDVLVSTIGSTQKSNPVLTKKLNDLIALLTSEQQILTLLKPAIANAAADPKVLSQYSVLMLQFFGKLKQNPDLSRVVDSLFQDATTKINNRTFDQTLYPTRPTYVMKNLRIITDKTATDIANTKDLATISIQLAAFINTKAANDVKVHIENFDNYSAGEYYAVPRWVTSFSEGDVNSFNQAAALSITLNKAVAGNFSDLLKLIPDTLNSYACFTNLVAEAQKDATAMAGKVANQKSIFIVGVQKQINDAYAAIELFQQQKSTANVNPLELFSQQSSTLINLVQSLPATIAALKSAVAADVMTGDADLKQLNANLTGCIKTLQADLTVITGVYNTVSNLLQPFQGTATAVQQATSNVYSFNINQIPAMGYIDLKTAGKRENGDNLVIKVITRTQDDVDKNLPGITLDSQSIEMQQVSFYSESNIAVILASPIGTNSDVTLKNKFQFAPSGSLVVKFGSRRSPFWNTINPGLGFNISTPDFNLDGSPDVSYGGVFTLFHNIVNLGLSYNTKTSSSFWFFGLSLPFSTFGLPIGNVQTQKQ
jgi:hypothetical protein